MADPGAVTTSRAARRTAPDWRIEPLIQEVTMKVTRIIWSIAAAALVLGCEQTTGPDQADRATPNLKVEHEEYQVQYELNYVGEFGCLDELMHVKGLVTVDKYRLWNPVQNPNRKGTSVEYEGLDSDHPDYAGPDFSMEGLVSGDIWIMDTSKNNKWNEKKHVFKDGSWVYHQDLSWYFTNEDGKALHIKGTYQLMKDADGWKMFHVNRGGCPEIW
jgi:hypothetical protein